MHPLEFPKPPNPLLQLFVEIIPYPKWLFSIRAIDGMEPCHIPLIKMYVTLL